MQARIVPKSALRKAIYYLLEQWPYLTRYLEDGRLELSNNRADRSIKPYSLIETAKKNSLDPYRYLLWVLQTAPQLSEDDDARAEKPLPANALEGCYMP